MFAILLSFFAVAWQWDFFFILLPRFAISLSGQLSLQNCARKKNRHRVFNQQYAWAKNAHVIQ
jgi:hypothetical protein